MAENKVGIYSPWVIFAKQMNEMFGEDPSIKLEFDDENKKLKMYVDGQEKADALAQILPLKKQFGNITLDIIVIPSNSGKTTANLFEDAFKGNPVFSYAYQPGTPGMYEDTCFVVFKNFVTQYKSDNLFDVHGKTSCLLENIAPEIFEGIDADVRYNTDLPGNPGMRSGVATALKDWPPVAEEAEEE